MTVKITKPEINVREELNDLKKPTGIAGEAMLRAETPQEQFNLIGAGRRNLIINGDMRIAQRGTSTTGITNNSGFHAVDRVKLFNSGGAGPTYTASQENDGPAEFTNSYKVQTTTADTSLPAAHYTILRLGLIEGQDLLGLAWGTPYAKALTLSFWVKSNKTGSQTILAATHDSMQQQNKQAFTIDTANTWEKKEITFAGNTATAMTDSITMGLTIDILVAAGSSYQGGTAPLGVWGARTAADKAVDTLNIASSTADYFQITGVQLETGKVATPFEHRSYGEELALCQRYYYRLNVRANIALMVGNSLNTTNAYYTLALPQPLRATPSVSQSDFVNYRQRGGGVNVTSTVTLGTPHYYLGNSILEIDASVSSGLPNTIQTMVYSSTGNDGYIEVNAEL